MNHTWRSQVSTLHSYNGGETTLSFSTPTQRDHGVTDNLWKCTVMLYVGVKGTFVTFKGNLDLVEFMHRNCLIEINTLSLSAPTHQQQLSCKGDWWRPQEAGIDKIWQCCWDDGRGGREGDVLISLMWPCRLAPGISLRLTHIQCVLASCQLVSEHGNAARRCLLLQEREVATGTQHQFSWKYAKKKGICGWYFAACHILEMTVLQGEFGNWNKTPNSEFSIVWKLCWLPFQFINKCKTGCALISNV